MMAARTWPVAVDQHVDDPAHILIGGAADLAAEHAFDLMLVEDGDFGRPMRSRRQPVAAALSVSFSASAPVSADSHQQQRGQSHRHVDDSRACRLRANVLTPLSAGKPFRFHGGAAQKRLGRRFRRNRTTETRMPPLIRSVSSDTVPVVSADPQVDARRTQLQVAQHHFVEKCRQPRIAQPDFVGERIKFEPQARLRSSANGVALAQACGAHATG